jgi:hypothetical protein
VEKRTVKSLNAKPSIGTVFPEPIALPMPSTGERLLGCLTREAIYQAAAAGKIKVTRLGRRSLVDLASARAFLAALPPAQLGVNPATRKVA